MSILHVFDMDGTLLRGSTASLQIAKYLGGLRELQQLENDFNAELIDTRQFAKRIRQLWSGLTPAKVAEVVNKAPWISGLRQVLTDIRERGEWSLVVTMSPDFFADHLYGMGVDTVAASRFPKLPFQEELDSSGILTPEDKVYIVDRMLNVHGLGRDKCIAYGDSASDIPLFKTLKYTVSVNGDDRIAPWSRLFYQGEDLSRAYELARTSFLGFSDVITAKKVNE